MKRTEAAVLYAVSKIGGKYSQKERWRNNPYTRDCSSFVWSAYDSTGYKMKDNTSTYEVYDAGFDLLYPCKAEIIGKQFIDIETLKKNGYKPTAGDIIFFNTESATARKNKITHVAIVENENSIVHARSTSYGIRRDKIGIYGQKIVAVTRLKDSLNIDTEASKSVFNAVCIGNNVNVREKPNGKIIGALNKNDPLVFRETESEKEWVMITTIYNETIVSGYMSKNYIKKI